MTFTSLKAAPSYGMAGCGFGSMILAKDSRIMQIFAATTNQYSGQTFSITTGTSNCSTDGVVHNDKAKEVFVSVHRESLEQEMAIGNGEKLSALGYLFGCSPSADAHFGQVLKQKFQALPIGNPDPNSLISAVKTTIVADSVLSQSCTL
ncbi:hypothetical protein CH373_07875 [Leptospira perolatii]|uniref:DUF3015 domain-containing protein n=2 Tax=Leptospira perolatii TaxID=2023191 RepID=A0A2M9ZNV3_9LEPT|nr:hypothetical protein CH360_13840 [Leptospira perolatii]PJZ73671.1 hypothetical protein CH373_07875 [Leptospira perolatii]